MTPNLPAFAMRNKSIVVSAVVLAVAWGVIAFLNVPRREDPEFKVNRCMVITQWPGATAQKIEELVTEPIETSIDELDEVLTIDSTNRVGVSLVRVELEDFVRDFDAAWEKIRAKVDEARDDLPDGAGEPFVNTEFGDTAAMVLALYQHVPPDKPHLQYSPRRLELFAEDFKDQLKLLPAVARVDLYGVQDEVIYLEADSRTWSQLALTTDELQQILQRRNIVAPGGQIDTQRSRLTITPSGDFDAVEDLNRVLIDTSQGGQLPAGRSPYLDDLGIEVKRGYREPPQLLTRVSPQDSERSFPCIVLAFTMKAGENIVELGEAARRTIGHAKQTILPPDVDVEIVSDQPRIVRTKIGDFLVNLYQAVIIVILVAFLLVGLRVAMVMAAAIPLVMIISIGVNRVFGVQLEQVSLASLIIALGLLVDCVIEVADNVHRFLEEGHSRVDAAVKGAQQIAFPVFIGTVTTVCAFLPMLLLPGMQGDYIYSLPVVVSTTLILSWLIAMTFTTLMAYWVMRPVHIQPPLFWIFSALGKVFGLFGKLRRGRPDGERGEVDRHAEHPHNGDSAAGRLYMSLCRGGIRVKWLTIGVAAAMFAAALMLPATGLVGSQFFPSADRDQFVVDLYLPDGVAIGQTDRVCRQVETLIRKLNRRDGRDRLHNLVSYVGRGGPRFFLNLDPEQPQSNYAQIVINTTDPDVVRQYVADIRHAARHGNAEAGIAAVAGARVVPSMIDMGPPTDTPIGIRIYGDDLHVLKQNAERLKDALRRMPETIDVHDTWGNSGYQIDVNVDEEKAQLAGVTNHNVAQTMNAFFSGRQLTTYREGEHRIPILFRLPDEERESPLNLKYVYVEGHRGKIPLDAVADIDTKRQPIKIRERDLQRMMEVRCRVREGLLANAVLERAMPAVRDVQASLPPGYRLEIGGEMEQTLESRANMRGCLIISVLLIVFCLIVQFNSVSKPLVILLALPMAVTGSLVGLYVTGKPLGFMAQLGLLSLAGVVINDSIVLIEFIEHVIRERRREGRGVAGPGEKSCAGLTVTAFRESVARGGLMRVLPISLTTLTTIGGLIPLALYGGPLFEPMAVVIIFGLALATFLTLFVIPALYALLIEHFGVDVPASSE